MNVFPSVYSNVSESVLSCNPTTGVPTDNASGALGLNSATIPSAGNSLSLVFNKSVTANDGGVTLSASGGPVTVSIVGVAGNIVFYSLSRDITSSESVLISYTGTAIKDLAGNNLQTITNQAVTNLSTVV